LVLCGWLRPRRNARHAIRDEEPGALANGSGATFCLHEADGDSAPLVAARIVDLFAANGLATLRAISALDVGQRETFGGASRSAIAVSRLT
jgi:hypothetical protein